MVQLTQLKTKLIVGWVIKLNVQHDIDDGYCDIVVNL